MATFALGRPQQGHCVPAQSRQGSSRFQGILQPFMPFSRRSLLVSGLALTAAGCATRPGLVPSDQTWPELEAVDVTAGREGVIVRLASRGCTAKADIVFRLDRSRGRAVLAFARRRLETCRFGEAGVTELVFSYQELGLRHRERFTMANPSRSSR